MYSLCLIVWLEVLEDTSLFYDTALSYCFGEKKRNICERCGPGEKPHNGFLLIANMAEDWGFISTGYNNDKII